MMGFSWLLALAGSAAAVYRDDAGVIDTKTIYLGSPLAVAEHDDQIALVSDAQVLTVLNEWGFLGWRQPLTEAQLGSELAIHKDTVVVGGEHLTGFNATDGTLLWTQNYTASQVRGSDEGIYVDSKYVIGVNGTLNEVAETGARQAWPSTRVSGNEVALSKGKLTWDSTGVLKFVLHNGTVQFTRDDGLAHVKQAVFVRPEVTVDANLENEFVIDPKDKTSFEENSFTLGLSRRLANHLKQMYNLVVGIVKYGPSMLVLPEPRKPQFELDQILVVLTEGGSLYGLNATYEGSVAWVYHDLAGTKIQINETHPTQFTVDSQDGSTYLMTYDGEFVGTVDPVTPTPFEQLEVDGNTVSSPRGWSIKLPGSTVVGQAIRDSKDVTSSIVAPLGSSGDVRYKYLNPFAAAFASYDEAEQQLVVTILDIITGRVLSQTVNSEKVLINEDWPLKIIYGEHWVVYTYLSLDASKSVKVAVVELYESQVPNQRLTGNEVNIFQDTLVPFAQQRTWISPSKYTPVHSLAVSQTLFGSSTREIIFGLENGIKAVPKQLLSVQAAPATTLEVPKSGHLSHLLPVRRAQQIIVGTTNLESTYLVAAVGGPDLFISIASPSGEFDHLNKKFPKIKLVIFIVSLGFAVFTMSPLVRRRVLEQQWR